MIIQDIKVMSVAAKFLDENTCWVMTTQHNTEKALIKEVNTILDVADVVVGHNVTGFDMKHLRGAALRYGLNPPSPYRELDTLRVARNQFKFTSNKLAELAKLLGVAPKSEHEKFPGFSLWDECMEGNDEAWTEMEDYNIQDVYTLEQVYFKLRPYMKSHPNVAIYGPGIEIACPKCGSVKAQRRGVTYTNSGKYQRYRCGGCGGWFRSRYTEYNKDSKKVLATNIA